MDYREISIKTMNRLKRIRLKFVEEYPFFGELLMNLKLAVADVATACTDGEHLVIDPLFASGLSKEELLEDGLSEEQLSQKELSEEELKFIYMHEIMHVAFLHCFRRGNRDKKRWNIACDYVVNSNVIMAMGLDDYYIANEPVMHLINGREAYHYTADEIYEMLPEEVEQPNNVFLDSHDIWEEMETVDNIELIDKWEQIVIDVTGKWYGQNVGIAAGSLRYYKNYLYKAQLKWKQILRDFIGYKNQGEDYGFRPPDKRFQDEEFIYPGLNLEEDEVVEHLWFFIDKSGSISRKMLMSVIKEVEFGLKQVKNLSGLVSFFDTNVTKPLPFSELKEFLKIGIPLPEGGTNFCSIFKYAFENRKQYKINGIIILTDGLAQFPEQNIMRNVPVLWIIIDNPNVSPKFGRYVHIFSKLQNTH